MHEYLVLASILGALGIGVVSPGPSFVLVARVAVATSRMNGLATALGMGLGSVVFAMAALFGLQTVLLAVPTMYLGLKILGGIYLCYLGINIFRSATQVLPTTATHTDNLTSKTRSLSVFYTQIPHFLVGDFFLNSF